MGSAFRKAEETSPLTPSLEALSQAQDALHESKKRKLEDETESIGNTPAMKRHYTTSDYIYSTLYVDGEGSDITITALDSSWNLHKVYLCQSPYFRSMLKGNWLESHQSEIHIEVPDQRIDSRALDIAFGSLYSDNINTETLLEHIVPTTAASCMLQLDGLMTQCEQLMQDTMAPENVCNYHDIAISYSLSDLERRCFSWLETNLLRYKISSVYYIQQDLLEKVLLSPNLFTMQVEMDIYNFVKVWVYLRLHPDGCQSNKKITDMQKYFHGRLEPSGSSTIPFLRTEEGLQFASLFRCLRLQHLLVDPKAIALVEKDCILPKEWLLPLYKEQWERMLAVFTSSDLGPVNVDQGYFDRHSCRCGRVLPKRASYCWRWTGFSYGVDLLLSFNHKDCRMIVKRNTFSLPCNTALCMQKKRNVAFRIKVFSLTETGMVTRSDDTTLVEMPMEFDGQITVFEIDTTWTFPLYISARFMLVAQKDNDMPSGGSDSMAADPAADAEAVATSHEP